MNMCLCILFYGSDITNLKFTIINIKDMKPQYDDISNDEDPSATEDSAVQKPLSPSRYHISKSFLVSLCMWSMSFFVITIC